MIQSFRCKRTEALFGGQCHPRFIAFRPVAERKLQMLDIGCRIRDLRIPPANRLEALKGDRKGQWRLCFRFEDGHAYDVEIVDDHRGLGS